MCAGSVPCETGMADVCSLVARCLRCGAQALQPLGACWGISKALPNIQNVQTCVRVVWGSPQMGNYSGL